MAIGMVTFVMCFQIIVLIHSVLEWSQIGMFTIFLCLIPILVEMTLPYVIQCHEMSILLKQAWKTRLTNNACERKIVLAFPPINILVGFLRTNLFVIKKATKVTYYNTMISFSITLLLYIGNIFKCDVTNGYCAAFYQN